MTQVGRYRLPDQRPVLQVEREHRQNPREGSSQETVTCPSWSQVVRARWTRRAGRVGPFSVQPASDETQEETSQGKQEPLSTFEPV